MVKQAFWTNQVRLWHPNRERLTDFDRQHQEQAAALSDPPPQTTHLLAADVPDG